MKHSLSSPIAAAMALALAACAAKSTPPPETPPETKAPPPAEAPVAEAPPAEAPAPTPAPQPMRDIVDTAEGSDTFKTLTKVINDAGLADALREDGPFTIFAPDDAAFAKLADGELERLSKDKKSLAALLNYHVLTGRAINSVELGNMTSAKTAAGPEITIESADGTIKINGAVTVVKADIMTTNGIIHVVDAVLSPMPGKKKPKKAK